MTGLLFPGQGSQTVGMGKKLYETLPAARQKAEEACEVLGYNLKELIFEGPEEKLTLTEYTQPAIFTVEAMYLEKYRHDHGGFAIVAGHSLGEYAALYAAGALSFADALQLVDKRAHLMAKENGKGSMYAVIGLEEKTLKNYLTPYGSDVVIANLNTKTQLVISGYSKPTSEVAEKLSGLEGVKVKKLKVSGAFHSPLMLGAQQELEKEIKKIYFSNPSIPIVSNITGKSSEDIDTIKINLCNQMTGQVRWYDTILEMKKMGVQKLYEVGQGHVLQKINQAIVFKPKCVALEETSYEK